MSLLTKILLIAAGILTLGALTFIIFKQLEISSRQQAIESQIVAQKQLVDNITRSQNSYATKDDIIQFIKDNNINLKAIQEDLDLLHASISSVNTIQINSNGQHASNLPSSSTGNSNTNGIPIDLNYLSKVQLLDLNESFGNVKVPFGQVGFSAWQSKPWSLNIAPREYHVTSVVGTDENQRSYFYNKFSVKVNDKEYDIQINKAETKQEFPEAKFSWWNPKLFITAGGAANITRLPVNGGINAGLVFSPFSYGKYKTNPDISILQVGAGYLSNSQQFGVIINPIAVNLNKLLPIVNNTYIGPSVQISASGNVFVGANITVGL